MLKQKRLKNLLALLDKRHSLTNKEAAISKLINYENNSKF